MQSQPKESYQRVFQLLQAHHEWFSGAIPLIASENIPSPAGGHISMGKKEFGGTAGSVRGLNVEYFPFDTEEMNIDTDATEKKIKKLAAEGKKPTLAMLGGSVLPFPHPIKELAPILQEHGTKSCYDAAHVAGLVAGHQFQDPMHEGAEAMTCSTHKTLPGPQG